YIERLCGQYPELRVVVVADTADATAVSDAFASGASAFCTKAAEPDDLSAAIRQSFEQSIYLAQQDSAVSAAPRLSVAPAEKSPELTRRELEILQLVAEGHSNSQLARMLWVTEQTVKFHL